MTKPAVLAALVGVLVTSVCGAEIIPERFTCAQIPLTKGNLGPIAICQLQLEMRRIGGPRHEVVGPILETVMSYSIVKWSSWSATLCVAGAIDCDDAASAIEEVKGAVDELSRDGLKWDLRVIHWESTLRAIPEAQLRSALRQWMRGEAKPELPRVANQGHAARLALELGYVDMLDDIERVMEQEADPVFPTADGLRAKLQIARIKTRPDSVAGLLDVVRDYVERDVAACLAKGARGGAATATPPRSAFNEALKELRLLNPPGLAGHLRALVGRYERVTEQSAADQVATTKPPAAAAEAGRGNQSANLSPAVRAMAELVGDLGDREFERTVLGGPTLWDSVNSAERVLLKAHVLQETATVTIGRSEQ